jgi:hypothetical protein
MKRKNKHTGDIIDFDAVLLVKDGKNGEAPAHLEYPSLEAAMEEWEEYKEPDEYWFINDLDGNPMKCELRYCPVSEFTEWSEKRKQIGNYFGTEEEARKAAEKLKAWKRLKDRDFMFESLGEYELLDVNGFGVPIRATMPLAFVADKGAKRDLIALFGGGE